MRRGSQCTRYKKYLGHSTRPKITRGGIEMLPPDIIYVDFIGVIAGLSKDASICSIILGSSYFSALSTNRTRFCMLDLGSMDMKTMRRETSHDEVGHDDCVQVIVHQGEDDLAAFASVGWG